jgi:hypothetical protein
MSFDEAVEEAAVFVLLVKLFALPVLAAAEAAACVSAVTGVIAVVVPIALVIISSLPCGQLDLQL